MGEGGGGGLLMVQQKRGASLSSISQGTAHAVIAQCILQRCINTHVENRETRTKQEKQLNENSSGTAELSWTSFGLMKKHGT